MINHSISLRAYLGESFQAARDGRNEAIPEYLLISK